MMTIEQYKDRMNEYIITIDVYLKVMTQEWTDVDDRICDMEVELDQTTAILKANKIISKEIAKLAEDRNYAGALAKLSE